MKTHVEFRSNFFAADEDRSANPTRRGRALAEYLATSLENTGFGTHPPAAEDWGWTVQIEDAAFPLWLGCGNHEDYPDGHLVFIEPSKPLVRRWLKHHDTRGTVSRLAEGSPPRLVLA